MLSCLVDAHFIFDPLVNTRVQEQVEKRGVFEEVCLF